MFYLVMMSGFFVENSYIDFILVQFCIKYFCNYLRNFFFYNSLYYSWVN